MKIHKGDTVEVLSGKHRGKTGEVIRAIPKKNQVIVAGVNIAKRSQKPVRATMQAGIIDKDMPLPVSAVALVCTKDGPNARQSADRAGRHEEPRLREVRGEAVSTATVSERPRLRRRYDEQLRNELKTALGLNNVMEVPTLEKIVINCGVGRVNRSSSRCSKGRSVT